MGNHVTKKWPRSKYDSTQKPDNNTIDGVTEKYRSVEQIKYKLLLLGAGLEGKSTLLKQLRMLHGRQFDQSELLAAKPHLTQNVIEAMRTLAIYADIISDQIYTQEKQYLAPIYFISGYLRMKCDDIRDLYIPQCIEQLLVLFSDIKAGISAKNRAIRDRVACMSDKQKFTREHYEDFQRLWDDLYIKKIYFEHKHKFQLIDTAEYLFENMHKYWKDEYIPTFQDLIHSYQRTTGVNKLKFVLPDKYGSREEIYEIFDTGGQKNERRKWMHFFDNTAAVIFVAALSAYNQLLWEDNRNNRLREAIGLFRGVVNLEVFKDSHFIVFFNKYDLFEKKVGTLPVKEHFKDFEGNEKCEEIVDFFIQKFKDQWRDKRDGRKTQIHFHVTSALDTQCVHKVFECCRSIIIKKECQIQGFL